MFKRSWKFYTKEKLIAELVKRNWDIVNDDVQGYWNNFESNLVEVIDDLCPLVRTNSNNEILLKPHGHIKSKMNRRNNLLKKIKSNPTNSLSARDEVRTLNKEIKYFFFQSKGKSVRHGIIPGNSKSLWDAVKIAKDINSNSLP